MITHAYIIRNMHTNSFVHTQHARIYHFFNTCRCCEAADKDCGSSTRTTGCVSRGKQSCTHVHTRSIRHQLPACRKNGTWWNKSNSSEQIRASLRCVVNVCLFVNSCRYDLLLWHRSFSRFTGSDSRQGECTLHNRINDSTTGWDKRKRMETR